MAGRLILAIVFIAAGALHFIVPRSYVAIVPRYLPAPLAMVYVSGAFELLGGIGLLAPTDFHGFAARKSAAWGLVALLIAVMPANIYMVTDHAKFSAIPLWALYLRLPMQVPLMWWCWLYTRG